MQTIDILWTGGLDSTYLMVRLSTSPDLRIRPHYILDEGRKSQTKELEAISHITALLKKHPDTKAEILDLVAVEKSVVAPDATVAAAWKRLNQAHQLGTQYDFLARYAKQTDTRLAVGVLFSDRGKVARCLDAGDVLRKTAIGDYDFLVLDAPADKDSHIIFGRMYFPAFMRNIEKTDEWAWLACHGYEEIAQSTWFCHRPVMGLTCGHCHPCQDALHEGMAHRVSTLGYVLGALRRFTYDPVCSILHLK